MKIESLHLPGAATQGQSSGLLKPRTAVLALVFSALFWLFAWYWDTAFSAVAIWQRSDTFAHGFLIFPISAWLIWQRRDVLARVELRPGPYALPLLALVGFTWLLARIAGVGVVQQFSLVLMIPLVLWAIAGFEVLRTLAFPLFFLLFAVPFGEFLEPILMKHTADFTIGALKLSGIPVYREGLYFVIPSGSWSVVEACSGLRYLIASLTLGLIYAYLTYRSFLRRALFTAVSIVVPIVANWLRAYIIVMIGHLSSMKYATGVDHLIYGWVFFGVVMMILFWIGSYWREDLDPGRSDSLAGGTLARSEPSTGAIALATVAVAAIVAAWPVLAARIENPVAQALPDLKAPPGTGGWRPLDAGVSSWTPRFYNYQASVTQAYTNGTSRVGLAVVYYRHQRPGAQLITTSNVLIGSIDREWRKIGENDRQIAIGNETIPSIEGRLRSASEQLLIWRWYWMDGQYVTNPYWAKLLQAKSSLLGRGDDSAAVFVYTRAGEGQPDGEKSLQDFVKAMLPAIRNSLEHARQAHPAS